MPTLNAMFKLMDGYSSQINKMINRTDEAMNKMLGTSKAADKTNDSFHKMGKGASLSLIHISASNYRDSFPDCASGRGNREKPEYQRDPDFS